MKFTETQLKAIKTFDNPVMVLATAGSGKTAVLSERVKYSINELNFKPETILAITFTNKATNEMRYKIQNGSVNVFTIHSFCSDILRKDIELLNKGYTTNFNIIDTSDMLDIIKIVMNSNNIRSNLSYNRILEDISNWINLGQELTKEIEIIKDLYFKYLEKFNLVTFDNMLLLVKELLENPFTRINYELKYKHILVDEFQDTNLIQYQLIKLLAGECKNVFIVGDDDQSIYSFRGSYSNIFNDFRKDFNPIEIHLEKNWRSNDKICNFANRLINFNINRITKNVYSDYIYHGSPININEFNFSEDEVNYVISDIKNNIDNIKKNKNTYHFAILYRNNFVSKEFEKALLANKIKYKIYGGLPFVKRKEIQDIFSYFKLLIDPESFLNFKRICNVPARGIGLTSVKKIHNYIMEQDSILSKAINISSELLTTKSSLALKTFYNQIIKYSNEFYNYTYFELFNILLSEFKYNKFLDNEETNLNIFWLNTLIKKLDQDWLISGIDKKEFLNTFINSSIIDDGSTADDEDVQVLLSTIHSVKGLEFNHVYLVNFEDEFLPFTYNRNCDLKQIEEERRIAFVGITRAKQKLDISYCKNRMYFGKYVKCNESRFIDEAIF